MVNGDGILFRPTVFVTPIVVTSVMMVLFAPVGAIGSTLHYVYRLCQSAAVYALYVAVHTTHTAEGGTVFSVYDINVIFLHFGLSLSRPCSEKSIRCMFQHKLILCFPTSLDVVRPFEFRHRYPYGCFHERTSEDMYGRPLPPAGSSSEKFGV